MSIYIISAIVILLVLAGSYALIHNTLERKRLQRQRLIAALKVRQRNLHHMAAGFPPHFLSPDLQMLIVRAQIDTCERLIKIEPRNPTHKEDLKLYTAQLIDSKKEPEKRVSLKSPAQVKEVRQHLQELLNFVAQQEGLKIITKIQASTFIEQIKRLSLHASIDSYAALAKQAQKAGKFRLAAHYCDLARKLLKTENANHNYDVKIAQLTEAINHFETKAAALPENSDIESELSAATEHTATDASKEWENFDGNLDDWKKKQIYD